MFTSWFGPKSSGLEPVPTRVVRQPSEMKRRDLGTLRAPVKVRPNCPRSGRANRSGNCGDQHSSRERESGRGLGASKLIATACIWSTGVFEGPRALLRFAERPGACIVSTGELFLLLEGPSFTAPAIQARRFRLFLCQCGFQRLQLRR